MRLASNARARDALQFDLDLFLKKADPCSKEDFVAWKILEELPGGSGAGDAETKWSKGRA